MGFGDFFSDAFNWVKGAATDVWNGAIKPVATGIFDVAKPIVQPVLGAVGGLVNKVGNIGGRILDSGERIVGAAGRFGEHTIENVDKIGGGLANFMSSPMFYIALGIGAIIILPRVLDRVA